MTNPVLLPWSSNLCHINVPGPGCLSGIAYDPLNNSLWLAANPSSVVSDYSLDVTLLDSIDVGHPVGFNALAFDAADDTLWTVVNGSNVLVQYALDPVHHGQVKQFGTPSGLPTGFYTSGDFQAPTTTQSIIDRVEHLAAIGALNTGNASGLVSKLEAAMVQMNAGNGNAARGQINAFINQVYALLNSGSSLRPKLTC